MLFNSLDEDRSGAISYPELTNALRKRAGLPPLTEEERRAVLHGTQRHAIRHERAGKAGAAFAADFAIDAPTVAEFHAALKQVRGCDANEAIALDVPLLCMEGCVRRVRILRARRRWPRT